MRCSKCQRDFREDGIEESHDIPCYIFPGNERKERKQYADKYGRHWLCKKCHYEYDFLICEALLRHFINLRINNGCDLSPHQKRVWRICNIDDQNREIAIKICKKLNEDFFKNDISN